MFIVYGWRRCPRACFGFSRSGIAVACKFMGLALSILCTGLDMEEIK
jgi:hypothetical protein